MAKYLIQCNQVNALLQGCGMKFHCQKKLNIVFCHVYFCRFFVFLWSQYLVLDLSEAADDICNFELKSMYVQVDKSSLK